MTLLVKPTANGRWSKTWSQRLRTNGKITNIGLGSFPVVTLAKAREKALDNARRTSEGENILAPQKKVPTLDEAFTEVINLRSPGWRGEYTKRSWLRWQRYCKPIGHIPISDITQSHVLKIIGPIWHSKNTSASDLRSTLSIIMDWAVTEGHRSDDPARSAITRNLGKAKPPVVHAKSLPHAVLGENLTIIRESNTWWAEKYALIFLALTCTRSGETRKATWDEIDLETATWTIPAHRMKGKIEHKVPLSTQAIQILRYSMEQGTISQGKVFPPQRAKTFIGDTRLSLLMKQLQIPAVPHGFRQTFKNWAARQPKMIEAAAEMVLAHTPSTEVKRAYQTDDFFEDRQPLMQRWADYTSETMGPVISPTN